MPRELDCDTKHPFCSSCETLVKRTESRRCSCFMHGLSLPCVRVNAQCSLLHALACQWCITCLIFFSFTIVLFYCRALKVGRPFEEMLWNTRRRGKDNHRWSPSSYCEESTIDTRRMIYTRSTAINMIAVVAEVGREVPNASAVLDAFLTVHNMVGMVHANKRDLEALGNRCSYLVACAIEKCRQRADGINLAPLECCFRDTAEVMNRCGGRGCVAKALKAVSDKGEIEAMNLRMDRLLYEMGLSGTKAILVSAGCDRRSRNDAAHDVPLMHACMSFLPLVVVLP